MAACSLGGIPLNRKPQTDDLLKGPLLALRGRQSRLTTSVLRGKADIANLRSDVRE